jgi:polyhydroxyalkanoate synthesis regulator phasin
MLMAERNKGARDRAQRIVSDLAKRGESRAKSLQKQAKEVAERSARSRHELAGLIQKEIRRQIRSLGLATRDEVERLQRRVRQLEGGKPARKATGKSSGARSRKPTKKKSSKR